MKSKEQVEIEGLDKAMDEFFKMGEKSLKELNPHFCEPKTEADEAKSRRAVLGGVKSPHVR